MKLAICNETYRDWDWDRAFAHATQHGYRGLEVAPFTLFDAAGQLNEQLVDEMMLQADKSGLQVIGLHWLLACTNGYQLTSSDESVRNATADYLKRLSRLCCRMGGTVMVFGSPQQRSFDDSMVKSQASDNAMWVIESILPNLEADQVVLALEPLGPGETNFMNTAEEAIELCKRVGSENVKLHLDVKAMSSEASSIPDIIVESRLWLAHFHANDPNCRGPGMGNVDFVPILKALNAIGYDGWISVEVFDQSVSVEELVEQSASNLRNSEKTALI